ncbi:DUF5723 family protein [Fulvivirgaceae bacterium BMA10]|uniref:DUF5723 family protein n=1 Tax=Splendidivirga corallicola TaxID=3051826 RepID=A0ABT8KWP2_9BACT|nr:DUF5723 family protein [Fulvivirgaceae bacterium BMA10]
MNKINVCVIALLLLVLINRSIQAQSFPGYTYDRYSGIVGARVQPANLAELPFKFDLALVGINAYFDNNYFTLRRSEEDFSRYVFTELRNRDPKYAFFTNEVLLPSFAFRLSLKHSLGFTARVRTIANANMTGTLSQIVANDFTIPPSALNSFSNQNFDFTTMSWQEYGLSYAWLVKDRGIDKIKAGATLKLLKGNGAAFVNLNDFGFTVADQQQVEVTNLDLSYGYSDNFDGLENNGYRWKASKGFNLGLDFGIVYERFPYRRHLSSPLLKKQSEIGDPDDKKNQYKYRISLAITDIGRLKFSYGQHSGRSNQLLPSATDFNIPAKLRGIESTQELFDSLATVIDLQRLNGDFSVGLNTAFRTNFDYHVRDHFFLNAELMLPLKIFKWSDQKVFEPMALTITPRWEKRWLGAYAPLYINDKGRINPGLGVRAGPLVLGVHDIATALSRKNFRSGGAFFVLKLSLPFSKEKSELECIDHQIWKRDNK